MGVVGLVGSGTSTSCGALLAATHRLLLIATFALHQHRSVSWKVMIVSLVDRYRTIYTERVMQNMQPIQLDALRTAAGMMLLSCSL